MGDHARSPRVALLFSLSNFSVSLVSPLFQLVIIDLAFLFSYPVQVIDLPCSSEGAVERDHIMPNPPVPFSEVKRHRARLVVRWGTTRAKSSCCAPLFSLFLSLCAQLRRSSLIWYPLFILFCFLEGAVERDHIMPNPPVPFCTRKLNGIERG